MLSEELELRQYYMRMKQLHYMLQWKQTWGLYFGWLTTL